MIVKEIIKIEYVNIESEAKRVSSEVESLKEKGFMIDGIFVSDNYEQKTVTMIKEYRK